MLVSRNNLLVREIKEVDFESIVDYFLKADKNFLLAMGVDESKLPKKEEWLRLLSDDHQRSIVDKKFFYVIWLLNSVPIGHSNINKIIFGREAYMHLHMWQSDKRQKGMGVEFTKMSVPYYFETFKLRKLYCEPYALNPAPNRTLERAGFEFIEQHETIPGRLNFFQPVNKWCMDFDRYQLDLL